MSNPRGFKQKLSTISRLWEAEDYDKALAEVESSLETWPGNAHLHILRASLVQLQEDPKYNLDEAKQALQQAVELDKSSPPLRSNSVISSIMWKTIPNPQPKSTPRGWRPLGSYSLTG